MSIIVFGFPHCGTSVLKSIIGHIDDVDETINESMTARNTAKKKFAVCKYPFTNASFFGNSHKDYFKIFILRDPRWVVSSLNKRMSHNIKSDHGIDKYIKTAEKFLYYQLNPKENLFLIKYEEIFENNFKKLKEIFDNIGLQYSENIFDNSKFENKIIGTIKIPDKKPDNKQHGEYRTWQINQPLVNNNIESKLDISPAQMKQLKDSKVIQELYPNIV